ncbi:S-layer homology domain-containing protein [Bifidobacterium miconisargentati]|uniref:S-layer homology domain-containing protein n=1 Tax=Bifidobacterium miconisargentati TaxID=2834437 RepID=UPI001BDC4A82|nr:S-layer homology domain-containing protein [Bifidobacterium miconisargentati]MBW3091306.1 S-layer homology domain-containing protein [Bifidobacterium miconisargentati]
MIIAAVTSVCMLFGCAAPAWGATDSSTQVLKQRMEQALADYNQADADMKAADSANSKAVAELNSAKSELDAANKAVENLQGPSQGTQKTSKDFLRWLMSRGLEGSQASDVSKALDLFDQAPSRVLQYTKFGDPDDATSLSNMVEVTNGFLDKTASLRQSDGGSSTTISMTNMAYAQLNANWAAFNDAHSSWQPSAENLAWGYPDPFYGWYDNEKKAFDQAVQISPNLESCRYTSSCINQIPAAGHYLNLVNTRFSAIGLAFSKRGSQVSWAYDSGTSGGAFTISQYQNYLRQYNNEQGGGSSAELTAAKNRQAKAQTAYDEAVRNHGLAQTKYENALKDAQGKWKVYKSAKQAYEDAGGDKTPDPEQPGETIKPVGSFADVSPSTPHYQDIMWLASSGISTGWNNPDGTKVFRPTAQVTRQDYAAFLYRLAGSPAIGATSKSFSDVDASTPHHDAILWAASNGIINGYGDGTFRGTSSILRQDAVMMIYRLAGIPGDPYALLQFPDAASLTPDFRSAIDWAKYVGITNGYPNGTFGVGKTIIRQDLAAFLHRAQPQVAGKW